ncbi:hypothetical protein [Saccharopolyspora flava]|uniref:hypothetical protein n=1 Tax=Saccharopolyspora flava TaxID=95161 RepID=UPI001114EC56|nr:hypothetical protein [Saccharopolyspora flava]
MGALLVTAVFLLTFPLRGGHGQHAGSGPGALTVWKLQKTIRDRSELSDFARYFIAVLEADRRPGTARQRARTEPPPYIGTHRRRELFHPDVVHPRVRITLSPGLVRPH